MSDHRPTTTPSEYPRRVLMAVTGKTPQIVTETLWALTVGAETPFVPTEIRLLTTEEGRRHAVQKLLAPDTGAFHTLCVEWGLKDIYFDESCIEVLKRSDGTPLEDIVTPEDNELAADIITTWVREATKDEDSAIHVSLAGGRKTMGYYVGYVLSMFGRPQDRLSHVLVDSEFEDKADFYYPTRTSKIVFTRDQKNSADAALARVHLAMIPFIRIKTNPSASIRLLDKNGFSATVAAAEAALSTPPSLVIDFASRTVICGGRPVVLTPNEFAMYAWMALRRRKLGDQAGVTFNEDGRNDTCRDYLEVVARMCNWEIDMHSSLDKYRNAWSSLSGGFLKKHWDEAISRIKTSLDKKLDYAAKTYYIGFMGKVRTGNKHQLRGLTIPPECIVVAEAQPPANFTLPMEIPPSR